MTSSRGAKIFKGAKGGDRIDTAATTTTKTTTITILTSTTTITITSPTTTTILTLTSTITILTSATTITILTSTTTITTTSAATSTITITISTSTAKYLSDQGRSGVFTWYELQQLQLGNVLSFFTNVDYRTPHGVDWEIWLL